MNDAIAPASVMPSSRIWPSDASRYESINARVDRLVLLTERRVDLELGEQRVDAERARLVGDDRHDARPDLRLLQQHAEQPRERHRRRRRHLLAGARGQLVDDPVAREHHRLRALDAIGQEAVERAPALHHVLVLRRLVPGVEVGRHPAFEILVGDLHVEPVAERLQLFGDIFLIWCVALRASKSAPSVQPFTVLARMTVGVPSCSTAVL